MNVPSLSADAGGWMQTFSGGIFHPAEPRQEDISIVDIASALARQCRYGGHCLKFYSVAEHCVLLHDVASAEHKFSALMHDASEAYLIDVPRPIKHRLANYREIEDRLMVVIASKYGFAWPPTDEVKRIDAAIVTDERAQNMAPLSVSNDHWGAPLPPLGVRLRFWSPDRAAQEFLIRFAQHDARSR